MSTDLVLRGRVAIVSGGGHGLGRAMVLALEQHGASVYVPEINGEHVDALNAATSERVLAECIDVSQTDEIELAVGHCLERFGRLDVVVNNAGPTIGALGSEPPSHFWQVLDDEVVRFLMGHAVGSFLLSKAAVPHLLRAGWGRIVTVTTSHATMTGKGRVPYGPAKAAMEAYAAVMAHDLEGSGVSVNVLIPGGSVATYPGRSSMSGKDQLDPVVMAPPIVWLASDRSDGISGRRIIASHWDEALSGEVNLERASAPIGWST